MKNCNIDSRDPSIECDTPLQSITSPDEILIHDITNDSRTSIIANILQQTHFDTWQYIEEIYKKLRIVPDDHIEYCNALDCDQK